MCIRDRISGVEGIVVATTDWMYGCRRVMIQPQALKDGRPVDSYTLDEPQCEIVKEKALVADGKQLKERPSGPRPDVSQAASPTR